MNAFKPWLARMLMVCVVGMGMPLPAAAGIVSTDRVQAAAQRDHVGRMLERTEVQERMQALGVDPGAARARVNALSDEDIALLAERIDQLPAGGDLIGALLFVFVVLLVTDILGFTRVFPFTRPVK